MIPAALATTLFVALTLWGAVGTVQTIRGKW